jgi:predicted nucleotidyltransferase
VKTDQIATADLAGRLRDLLGNRLLRVILYVSRAWGTERPNSDFDLLVVERDPVPDPLDEEERIAQSLAASRFLFADVYVMGETEFEQTRNLIGGIAYPATREGVLLYARS